MAVLIVEAMSGDIPGVVKHAKYCSKLRELWQGGEQELTSGTIGKIYSLSEWGC